LKRIGSTASSFNCRLGMWGSWGAYDKVVKDYELNTALSKASGGWDVAKGLFVSQVRGKFVYRSASFSDELILRKLNRNLVENAKLRGTNRDSIVANIKEVLREGIEYRVYRLDIKSFYESICVARAIKLLDSLVLMSQPTKKHIKALLEFHAASGKTGVPSVPSQN
ncbi:hypothetical protein RYA07_28535, partial [Pseudomonas syringae pv. actinidiae]|nr:hypothetical protein [Pseudomonas syringae pv. actinidiae]